MPDLDLLQLKLAPGWGRPYHLMAGGGTGAQVADAALRALATGLRRHGGIPGLVEAARLLQDFTAGRIGRPGVREAMRQIQREHHHSNTNLLARALDRHLIIEPHQALSATEARTVLAQGTLNECLDHHLYSKAVPMVVGEGQRFSTAREAAEWIEVSKGHLAPSIEKLGDAILFAPNGKSVRLPRQHREQRISTATLLETPLGPQR